MKTKLFEVRDRETFLPVFSILMEPTNEGNAYLLRRAGYRAGENIIMTGLCGDYANIYEENYRTMPEAHKYIKTHFNEMKDGDVICVETILGERETPKTSERFSCK